MFVPDTVPPKMFMFIGFLLVRLLLVVVGVSDILLMKGGRLKDGGLRSKTSFQTGKGPSEAWHGIHGA